MKDVMRIRKHGADSKLAVWRRQQLASRAAMVSMLALLLAIIGLVAAAGAVVRGDAIGGVIALAALVAAALVAVWASSVRSRLEAFDRELQARAALPRQQGGAFARGSPAAQRRSRHTQRKERRAHERVHRGIEGSPGAP
jgi:hypothetical protein